MLQEGNPHRTWATQFAATRSESEVVEVVNDYLATWLPSDLEHLPEECRLVQVTNVDAVSHAAVVFTQCELHARPESPAAAVLGALSEIFIAAQVRVRQLRSSRFDPSAN